MHITMPVQSPVVSGTSRRTDDHTKTLGLVEGCHCLVTRSGCRANTQPMLGVRYKVSAG